MNQEGTKRKLAAILSADVKEYSRLMSQDERGTIRTLKAYKETMSSLIEEYKGRVVDAPGDNVLAEFGSVVDAVNCGVEIQRELAERNANLPPARQMQFRIGINLGDIVEEEGRIYGDGVNIAARVEGLAEGGGICISGKVYEEVEGKLGLEYEYLGKQEVKNIEKPVLVYRVLSFAGAAGHKRLEPPSVEPAAVEKMTFPLPEKPSIAVLPFVNMSGDPEQEYFSDGITEEIITGLSKVPRLLVIARNSTFTYKGKSVKVQQVGKELGVRYVLEGSVRKAGDRVRITAQLVDAETGHHLWVERYDRQLGDIFAIQDEITLKIMVAMAVRLTEGEQAHILAKGTENIEAFEKSLHAWEHIRESSKAGNVLARQLCEEAIALDPKYARAYSFIAFTHLNDVLMGFSEAPDRSIDKAVELAERAQALDEFLPITYALLGHLHLIKRDHERAILEVERALALSPNSAEITALLAQIKYYSGRYEEAVALFNKAIRLNPYPPAWHLMLLGAAHRFLGRYEEAITAFKKALHTDPDHLFSHFGIAATYSLLGRQKEARTAAAEVLRISPDFSIDRFVKALPYKNQADLENLIKAVRKAGLPE